MTEELKTIDTVDTSPFKKLVMTIGELPTSFVESMTYYELLAWLCNYLQGTVIPAVNNNGEAVTELQQLYIELKSYVDNYFDNLDVQEEINNKLDQMAEDGQLTQLIAQFLSLNAIMSFQSVAAMKLAENLVNGSTCETYGFYSVNDGGGAKYLVRTITNDDIVDEKTIIALYDNTLIAELIHEDTMSVKQFGAKGDGTTNDYPSISSAISYTDTIYFPAGTYLIGNTINLPSNKKLYGDGDSSILLAGDTDHIISIVSKENIVVEKLKLDGDAKNKELAGTLSSAIFGLNIDFSQNVVVRNVTFENMGYLAQTYRPDGTSMGGNMLSLNVNEDQEDKENTENCIIDNCKFIDPEGRSSFGIRVWSNWDISETRKYYVRNNKISNCYFEGNNYNNIELAGQGVVYNVIENCTVINSKAIAAIEADKGASYNIFNNNILDGLECTSTFKVMGFNCSGYAGGNDNAIGNEFNNNIIRNVKFNTSGTCTGFMVSSAEHTIINNLLIDTLIPYESSTNGCGIEIDVADDTLISNSIVRNGTNSNGIYILPDTCGNITIDSCNIDSFNYGVRTSGGTQPSGKTIKINNTLIKNIINHGINIGSGIKSALITNNSFDACGTGVRLQSSAHAVFVNNSFRNITGNDHYGIKATDSDIVLCCEGNYLDGCSIDYTSSNLENRILNNFFINNPGNRNKVVTYGSAAPSTGQWYVGSIVYNQTPTAGGNIGWVCTTAGTPGTWKAFGTISS